MAKYRFSVFTATYNREALLPKVYECLKNQTFKDFEWIIVNDGSCDGTESLCRTFVKEAPFPVKYVKHETNRGKHEAWRSAMKIMEGEYEVGADDDDIYPPRFLEIFDNNWKILEHSADYMDYWEIRARCSLDGESMSGPKLPTPIFDSDYNDVNYRLGIRFLEMQGCRKVSVLRAEASVPEHFFYDEFVSNFPEGIRWSRAARKYKTRFIEEIVRIYVQTEGGLAAANSGKNRSLTKTFNALVWELYTLVEQRDFLLKYRIKWYLQNLFTLAYHCICVKRFAIRHLKYKVDKTIACSFLFPAFLLYFFRH